MFSHINVSRWALSISASALTVAGIFGPAISPAVAQQGQCERRDQGLRSLQQVPANVLNFARRQAPNGNQLITNLADVEREGGQTIYELRGFRPNGCSVEVDIIASNPPRLDEVEEQLPSVNALPQPVRQTLRSEVPNFQATLIERSIRPGGQVVYELEGRRNGQAIEVDINANGTNIQIQPAS